MKQYADYRENMIYKKHENLADVLKANFLKAEIFEKALKEKSSR